MPLTKNALKPLAKSVLIPLGLTAAALLTDVADRLPFDLALRPLDLASRTATLITSNDKLIDIMNIVKSLEEFSSLIKGVSETIKNEAKEQKSGFCRIILGTFGASLLGNLLTNKGTIKAGAGTIRADQIFNATSYFN